MKEDLILFSREFRERMSNCMYVMGTQPMTSTLANNVLETAKVLISKFNEINPNPGDKDYDRVQATLDNFMDYSMRLVKVQIDFDTLFFTNGIKMDKK